MTRKKINKADYFPHYVHASRTLKIIKSQYGDSGYTFWFELLALLADTEDHFYTCKNTAEVSFLQTLNTQPCAFLPVEILDTLAELEAIDPDLWSEKVIWCQHLVDGLTALYSNRGRELPQKPITTSKNTAEVDNYQQLSPKESRGSKEEERENSDARAREDNIIPMQRWEPGGIEYRTMDKFQELYNTVIAHPHKESDAVNQIVHLADKYGDPEQVIPEMMAMLARLKDEDQTARGFWRKPYLPSTLVSHWSQVLEELKTAKADAEEWEDIDEEENVWS